MSADSCTSLCCNWHILDDELTFGAFSSTLMFGIKVLTCYRFMGFNDDKKSKVDLRDDLSYFAVFDSDRIDWDAHNCHTSVHIQL
jgi:hypothetical protein